MGQTSVGQPAPLTTTAHKDSEELAGRQPQAKGVRNRRCVLRPPAEGPRAGKVELGLFQIAMGHNTKAVSQCREGHGHYGHSRCAACLQAPPRSSASVYGPWFCRQRTSQPQIRGRGLSPPGACRAGVPPRRHGPKRESKSMRCAFWELGEYYFRL